MDNLRVESMICCLRDEKMSYLCINFCLEHEDQLIRLVEELKKTKCLKKISFCGITWPKWKPNEHKLLIDGLKLNRSVIKITGGWTCRDLQTLEEFGSLLRVNDTITHLDASYSYYGPNGGIVFGEALKVNQTLKTLFLTFHSLGADGGRAIAEALKVNKSVTLLCLSCTKLGPIGSQAIGEALCVNRTLLDLRMINIDIGLEGSCALGKALQVNHVLKELCISVGQVCMTGLKEIANALKVNCGLKKLDLGLDKAHRLNGVTERIMTEALFVNGSIINNVLWNDKGYHVRNMKMHQLAQTSVVCLLALRRIRNITLMPKEMFVMLGKFLWNTRADINAWER